MSSPPVNLTPEQTAAFDASGYLVVPGYLSAGEVAVLRDTFMQQAAEGPVPYLSDGSFHFDASDPLTRYPRMMLPHKFPDLAVGPLSLRYLLDDRAHHLISTLMREEPLGYQSMFYFKPAGARGQHLHQDNYYVRVAPATCIALWISLDDADAENGTMVVVPGTQGKEIVCPQQGDTSVSFSTDQVPVPDGLTPRTVDLRAGDALLFNGSLIHGSHPNTSQDRFRRAFICHYVPRSSAEVSGWARPLFAFDGTTLDLPVATGGGPCGTGAAGPH